MDTVAGMNNGLADTARRLSSGYFSTLVKHFQKFGVYICETRKNREEDAVLELSKAEEAVLLAVWRLEREAYGVSIRGRIKKDLGKDYTYGTLYGLLRQLAFKGLVEKRLGPPTPEKGGRGKTYFDLTPDGIKALKDAIAQHRSLWGDLGEWSFDER
jgi:PadR family transcriptional regulator PadR